MYKKFLAFHFFFLFLSFSFCAYADSQKNLFIVRGNENYPPYEMTVNEQLSGLHIDIVKKIAKNLDIHVTFKSYPWARAMMMIEKGKADAITYLTRTKDREKNIHYMDGNVLSIEVNMFTILTSRKNEIKFSGNLRELKQYKILMRHGFSYGEKFDKANYLNKVKSNDWKRMPMLLLKKRIDLAIVDYINFYLNNHDKDFFNKMFFLQPPVTQNPQYIE